MNDMKMSNQKYSPFLSFIEKNMCIFECDPYQITSATLNYIQSLEGILNGKVRKSLVRGGLEMDRGSGKTVICSFGAIYAHLRDFQRIGLFTGYRKIQTRKVFYDIILELANNLSSLSNLDNQMWTSANNNLSMKSGEKIVRVRSLCNMRREIRGRRFDLVVIDDHVAPKYGESPCVADDILSLFNCPIFHSVPETKMEYLRRMAEEFEREKEKGFEMWI